MANGSGVYGRGLTKSSILQSLMKTDNGKTGSYWEEAMSDINKGYDEARDVYSSQFTDAVNEAYAARRRRENLINMSTVVGGGKQALLGQSDTSYEQAYDAYRQNLAERNQALSESYSQSVEELQQMLNERAENFANFGNMHYDYLKYLYDKYYVESEKPSGPWTNDIFRKMYLTTDTSSDGTPLFDENGNPILDEEGNQLYEHLRSMQSLYNTAYDEEGNYTSVYDENGYLTEFGRAYFDMIENMQYGSDAETFGDWLYQKDQDLWEYMYESPNIFDSSSDNTNAGTFRELTGRDAKDYTYSIAEHLGSLSKGTIASFFDDVYSNIDNVFRGNLKDRGQSAIDNSVQIVDQLEKLSKDLSLDTEFDSSVWDALRSAIKLADEHIKSGGEMTLDWFNTTISVELQTVGITTAATSAIATLLGGPAGTGIGATAGLVSGGLVGFIGGLISASIDTNNQRKQNEQYANDLKNQLRSIADNMVYYSLSQRNKEDEDEIKKYLEDRRYKSNDLGSDVGAEGGYGGGGGRGI